MADQTPLLGLPYILPSQAQKHVTHNEGLNRLDAIVQLAVLQRTLNTPPITPAEGDRYIVAPGGTSEWQGQDGNIATRRDGSWLFVAPKAGWQARVLADASSVIFNGSGWEVPPLELNDLPGVGINTTIDATNRLAVAAEATLLTHDGAGHQLKINKAITADTASLLFQTSWSGRAEMGTMGKDAFGIKVSANGSGWTEALVFDGATGAASGAAVQQSRTDVTEGRLMRADYGYGPGNLLGAVSQTGGIPQGAVIERGSNANGDYVRFADGTQICIATISLGSVLAAGAGTWANPYRTSPDITWTFPAAFSTIPQVIGRPIPPSGASSSADRRRSIAVMGRANTLALYQIHVARLSAVTDADVFEIGLTAIGNWF